MKLPQHIESRVTWQDPPTKDIASLPTIKSIEPIVSECDLGCGKIVDQHQGVNIIKRKAPVEYWQRQCKVCKLYRNPQSMKYDCSLAELNAILRPKKYNKDK